MLRWKRIQRKISNALRSGIPKIETLLAAGPTAEALHGAFRLRDLKRSVESSLRALRTDYLDILLLHECSGVDAARADILDFLKKLQGEGKIRTFGIATGFDETLQILKTSPQVAPVAQFQSDALNRNMDRLPANRPKFIVTHSAIKCVLPRLLNHLSSDSAIGERWLNETGIDPTDRTKIAGLLLTDAVRRNSSGITLFSSSRPENIKEAVAAINRQDVPSEALRGELDLLGSIAEPSCFGFPGHSANGMDRLLP